MLNKKKATVLLSCMLGFILLSLAHNSQILTSKVSRFDILSLSSSTITVTNPTSSSSWELSTTHTITWTTTGDVNVVDITLYKDNSMECSIHVYATNDGSYSWFIPNDLEPDSDYQVVITDVYEPSVHGYSQYFEIFGTPAVDSITVTSPTSASSWQMCTVQTITWTTTGSISHVYIDLYKDNSVVDYIESYVRNDGSYDWFIPNDLQDGSDYKIRIGDTYYYYTHDYSENFEIFRSPEPKSITVTNPFSLTSWQINSTRTITWSSTGDIASIEIEVHKDNSFLKEITASTPNDGSYNWQVPANFAESNTYRIKLCDSSDNSISDFSDYFSIVESSSNSKLVINSPNSSSIWNKGNEYLIEWTCDQDASQFNTVDIKLYKGNNMVITIAELEQNSENFLFSIPENIEESNDYRIYIKLSVGTADIYQFSNYFSIIDGIKNSSSDPFISGYNIMIILGILSVISYTALRKYIKK